MSASRRPPGRVSIDLERPVLLGLLTVVALFVAFVGGHLASRSHAVVRQRQVGMYHCPYELPASQSYILAGFQCPELNCERPVGECHSDAAHRVQSMVKDLLLQGRSPEQIRAEIVRRYGPLVQPD
jgi:cytochrome c-type biogenesis protein CcmH/NrfF